MTLASAISTRLAEVHDRDAVGDVAYRTQVVRDEEVCEIALALQALHQVHYLRLNRHVERGDGLVRDDEVRVGGEGARDADALPLPARELVRVSLEKARAEAHGLHQLAHARLALAPPAARPKVSIGSAIICADRHARVQRRVWVLENHLKVLALVAHLAPRELREIFAAEEHLPAGRLGQAQHGAAQASTCRSPTRPRAPASRRGRCRSSRRPRP